MSRIDIFEENKRLREENEFLKKQAKEWKLKYYELDKRLKEVEAKLNQLLNINTPSSVYPPHMKPVFTSPNRPPKGTNPRGKPEGGNGATRELPKNIDRKVRVEFSRKEKRELKKRYGEKLKIKTVERFVYDIPKIEILVTKFIVQQAYVGRKLVDVAKHPDLPHEGIVGPHLQTFMTELKHGFAGSYNRISTFIDSLTGTTFTPQAINNSIHRVANHLEPSYNELETEIRNSEAVGSDETCWPVDGEKWWLWVLTTLNIIFLMIKDSRGRKVITRILSSEFNGVITSDCLNVYQKFAEAFQRCWSHLLRRTHSYAEKYPKRDIKKLHEQLSNLYHEITAFLETGPSFEERVWKNIMYQQDLQQITYYRWRSKLAQSITNNYLRKYAGQWLVPVIMPEVELTNNRTERGIRKVIPTRKLLGGHRTKQGAKDFAIIETHRQTWRLRNESPYNMMVDYLKQQNIAA